MEPITFMTSLLTFYIKGEIKQEQNFLKLKIPNTILTFIPLGVRKDTVPVNQIASVDTNFKLILKNFLVGLIVAFWGLSALRSSFLLGFLIGALGIGMVINSFQVILSIHTTSGAEKRISFLVVEKAKAESAAETILRFVSGRMDDTNVRQQNEVLGDRLTDAITSLKNNE